jgi:hypothetical protein
MEALALIIVKTVITTFLKYYIASLMAASGIVYNSAELGYRVPKWYMNPGKNPTELYAYGTSTEGDEFESLEKAQSAAVHQMAKNIQLANKKMINDKVKYNRESIRQRRLIDLFVKGDGLNEFVRMNAVTDQKQLVKTKDGDMRAFVRISLDPQTFFDYQKKQIHELKTKIIHQKRADILDEMDDELKNYNTPLNTTNQVTTPLKPDPPPMNELKPTPLKHSSFDDLEKELDSSSPQ